MLFRKLGRLINKRIEALLMLKAHGIACFGRLILPCSPQLIFITSRTQAKRNARIEMIFIVYVMEMLQRKLITVANPWADLGGVPGQAYPPPPPQNPILSFLHTFSAKSTCIGGPCPPNGSMSPIGNPGSVTATLLSSNYIQKMAPYGPNFVVLPISLYNC